MSRGNVARNVKLRGRHLGSFATETTGELDILGLDGNTGGALVDVGGNLIGNDAYRLAWIAQRLVSSNKLTRYASTDSWRAPMADDWKRRSDLKSWAISRTRRWKGSLRMRSSVDFW